jgi:dihydroceramide fatty acyl 2-hydroxylase
MSDGPEPQLQTPTEESRRDFVDAYGIDLSRPLYPQVAALGDRYFAWVHTPVRRATLRRLAARPGVPWAGSVRIFDSDRLEPMTHISWRLVLALWLPVVVLLPVVAWRLSGLSAGRIAALMATGLVAWTFAEYVLHRWIFHTAPRGPLGIRAHFLAHGIHHLDPSDKTRLVFPPLLAAGIALVIFAIFTLLLPAPAAMVVMAGLLAGYLVYDMSHYISHHGRVRDRWFRFLSRYHNAHHHREPDAMFGVSSPIWDVVFRSGSRR